MTVEPDGLPCKWENEDAEVYASNNAALNLYAAKVVNILINSRILSRD